MSVDARIKYPQGLLKVPSIKVRFNTQGFVTLWSPYFYKLIKVISGEAIVLFLTLKTIINFQFANYSGSTLLPYLALIMLYLLRKFNTSKSLDDKRFKVDVSLAVISIVAYLLWSLGTAIFLMQCILLISSNPS